MTEVTIFGGENYPDRLAETTVLRFSEFASVDLRVLAHSNVVTQNLPQTYNFLLQNEWLPMAVASKIALLKLLVGTR